jgi:hypothetical protein
MNTSEVAPLFNIEISDMHQSDDLGEMVEVDLSSDEFINSDFDQKMRYEYCEEDVQLAIKMGMTVNEMFDLFQTLNDEREFIVKNQPEYSPEWPIDFMGDEFYAYSYEPELTTTVNVSQNIHTLPVDETVDTPLHMPPLNAGAELEANRSDLVKIPHMGSIV